jgi:hypothetical protein
MGARWIFKERGERLNDKLKVEKSREQNANHERETGERER